MRYTILLLLVISFNSVAIDRVSVVYRADGRNMEEVSASFGMWPWGTENLDSDLTHHFEGESIDGMESAFVSTTASLRVAVEHAAFRARPNSFEPFDEDYENYIYVIRPSGGFYSVDDTLTEAMNSRPINSPERNRISSLINDYTGMEEFVAFGGLSSDRIIRYAEINGGMLNHYGIDEGSPLFSESFWASRWINNGEYNQSYDDDLSSDTVYNNVGNPSGAILLIRSDDGEDEVPVSDTCLGVSSKTSFYFNKEGGDNLNSCPRIWNGKRSRLIYDESIVYFLTDK